MNVLHVLNQSATPSPKRVSDALPLDCTITKAAYEAYTGNINGINKAVFDELFHGSYLEDNSNKIEDAIENIRSSKPSAPRSEMISQLAAQLPRLECFKGRGDYEQALMAKGLGAQVLNILEDSGAWTIITDYMSRTTADGTRITIPKHIVQLGGEVTPKDFLKGLFLKPGERIQKRKGNYRFPAELSNYQRSVSSMAFKVSDYITPEIIQKGHELSKDYWSDSQEKISGREARKSKHAQYALMGETIMGVSDLEQFYLSINFDTRYRCYYDFCSLQGMRPQGKLHEVCAIDSAVARPITGSGANHLKHIIYVARYGRTTLVDAANSFTQSDHAWARDLNPLDEELVFDGTSDPLEEFGDRVMLNKAAIALDKYSRGEPCHYMFGKDLTNSGLMMAGASFKSPEMMMPGNLVDGSQVFDSHTAFGAAYGLSRNEAKPIHQGLMHGMGSYGLAHLLEGSTAEEITASNIKAYGPCIENITNIAQFGKDAIDNRQTQLSWKTIDGFRATHVAKFSSVPLKVHAISAGHGKGYTTDTVVCSLPMHFSGGSPLYKAGHGKGVHSTEGVGVKLRGLYANITHGLDGWVLRKVVLDQIEAGEVMLMKHDDYICNPSSFDRAIYTVEDSLVTLQDESPYEKALECIKVNSKGRIQSVPHIVKGNCDIVLGGSSNFLMP